MCTRRVCPHMHRHWVFYKNVVILHILLMTCHSQAPHCERFRGAESGTTLDTQLFLHQGIHSSFPFFVLLFFSLSPALSLPSSLYFCLSPSPSPCNYNQYCGYILECTFCAHLLCSPLTGADLEQRYSHLMFDTLFCHPSKSPRAFYKP